MTDDLLSLREAADLLSRSYGSVRVSRHRGDFPEPALMIGTVPAFARADIEAWRDRKRWAPKDHAEKVKAARTGAAIARASDALSVDIGQSAASQPARASPETARALLSTFAESLPGWASTVASDPVSFTDLEVAQALRVAADRLSGVRAEECRRAAEGLEAE